MIVCTTYKELSARLKAVPDSDKIGFVPTMGALHEGHLALFKRAREHTQLIVGSIFVNPTQFNNPEDLKAYPRPHRKDLEILEKAGTCDILFLPANPKEVYNSVYREINLDTGILDKVMEGKHRPGHFKGVINVVNQLFNMINPDMAFFGEKDFQQLAIIKEMVKILGLNVTIVPCPIIREPSGLAMSSRNERLSDNAREHASLLHQILSDIKDHYLIYSAQTCLKKAKEILRKDKAFTMEYIELVDGDRLTSINEWHDTGYVQVCIAAWIENVRLIDNLCIFNAKKS